MSLLEVKNLKHRFRDKELFEDASFELYKGEHMGLVGENGAGKSTLFRLLLNEILPDDGEIIWQKNIKIGYIKQHLKSDNISVLEYLKEAYKEEFDIEKELNKMYEEIAQDYDEKLLNKIGKYQEELEKREFYQIESEIDKVIVGLGINSFGENKLLSELSGGQQTKVIIAKLLLEKSDVLLLDEPTNFLDDNHIKWLSEYLSNFKGTFIVISHNIEFLESVTNTIIDIEFQDIKKYHGDYNKFLRLKDEYKRNYIRSYEMQQVHIKKTEEFIRRNKAGVNSKIARGRQKQLDRVDRLTPPSESKTANFDFSYFNGVFENTLIVKDLEVGYDYSLLPPLNFRIQTGEKVAITGFNGIGKSTLLKTLYGEIEKIDGSFKFSKDHKIGYYEQELNWKDPSLNPLEIIRDEFPRLKTERIRRELTKCGIESKDLEQAVGTLSGGEQSKVKICRLILKEYNFLFLDEPTNHLDKETKEVLQRAIVNFEGTVILVCHERDFYEDFIDREFKIGKR